VAFGWGWGRGSAKSSIAYHWPPIIDEVHTALLVCLAPPFRHKAPTLHSTRPHPPSTSHCPVTHGVMPQPSTAQQMLPPPCPQSPCTCLWLEPPPWQPLNLQCLWLMQSVPLRSSPDRPLSFLPFPALPCAWAHAVRASASLHLAAPAHPRLHAAYVCCARSLPSQLNICTGTPPTLCLRNTPYTS
jgi:hypothetical protein